MNKVTLHNQDCIKMMRTLSAKSIDLIATDPPYFRVKANDWDNQWPNEAAFLEWLESVIKECARVLKDTGSIYLFASPQLASKIEAVIARYFVINNHIVWVKTSGKFKAHSKTRLRRFVSQTERIIFATALANSEKVNYDRAYAQACKPLIDYLVAALKQAGLSQSRINQALGTQIAGHWFGRSQWRLPSQATYSNLQTLLPTLSKPHKDMVAWRDKLLDNYHDPIRRYFNGTEGWYTDVWECSPVQYYDGKHPCEKPQKIMEHIIKVSSQKGDLVLDPFLGGGATGYCGITFRQAVYWLRTRTRAILKQLVQE